MAGSGGDNRATYKFDLAFENAIARDSVTEKFFDPLVAGCIPVYLGAPNINEYTPGKHCFINISNFLGPKELADDLIQLDKNDTEYQQYLAWKRQPFKQSFLNMLEQGKEHPFVHLCREIREIQS
ncbi:MAG: hypothetical protein GY801_39540 [bacterium]|nr:hypothetical protein [bacterium]